MMATFFGWNSGCSAASASPFIGDALPTRVLTGKPVPTFPAHASAPFPLRRALFQVGARAFDLVFRAIDIRAGVEADARVQRHALRLAIGELQALQRQRRRGDDVVDEYHRL